MSFYIRIFPHKVRLCTIMYKQQYTLDPFMETDVIVYDRDVLSWHCHLRGLFVSQAFHRVPSVQKVVMLQRCAIALLLLSTLPAHHASISQLYVLGDSLSDDGLLFEITGGRCLQLKFTQVPFIGGGWVRKVS